MRPVIYFPMEIASRELDSRLLLSVLALQRGYDVVLGQKWLLERNIRHMPPGIYVSKTLTKRDGQFMDIAKQKGYCVVSIDEEMPGLVAENDALRWISKDALSHSDLIFINGIPNRDTVTKRFPGIDDRVKAAGNPRWDMLRPELRDYYQQECDKIRQRYGRFVLINTNFGWTNSEKGPADVMIAEQIRLGKLNPQELQDATFVNDVLLMEEANREALMTVIKSVARQHPDLQLILRPHPSERLDTWKQSLSAIANLEVVRDGPAVPWILASDVLLHTNCTTGVEALALSKPALCLLTNETMLADRYLANRVNPIACSADEAISILEQFLSTGDNLVYTSVMRQEFENFMSSLSGQLGAEVILDYIEHHLDNRELTSAKHRRQWLPKVGYKWLLRDKNSRGALLPDLNAQSVVTKVAAIAQQLAIDVPLNSVSVGSKVVLLSQQPVGLWLRLASTLHTAFGRSLAKPGT